MLPSVKAIEVSLVFVLHSAFADCVVCFAELGARHHCRGQGSDRGPGRQVTDIRIHSSNHRQHAVIPSDPDVGAQRTVGPSTL